MAHLRRLATSPIVLVMLIASSFGEGLSGSTPALDLLLPWNLAFTAALYGCGALVCREVAHRFGLGFTGLVVLGVAYGVWEEALVDRYWFYPSFWEDSGVDRYSVVWHTNLLLAAHLTVFHAAISITASVLVVEWLAPQARHRPWVGRRGLAVASVVLAATPILYGEIAPHPPIPVLTAAVGVLMSVVAIAFALGRRSRHQHGSGRPRRFIGTLAFGCALAHWVLTYSVAETGLPWPVGVGASLAPVVLGMVVVRRLAVTGPYGSDGVRTVVGLLTFFVLLDVFVGSLGRYDMVVGALVTAFLVRRLYRHRDAIALRAA